MCTTCGCGDGQTQSRAGNTGHDRDRCWRRHGAPGRDARAHGHASSEALLAKNDAIAAENRRDSPTAASSRSTSCRVRARARRRCSVRTIEAWAGTARRSPSSKATSRPRATPIASAPPERARCRSTPARAATSTRRWSAAALVQLPPADGQPAPDRERRQSRLPRGVRSRRGAQGRDPVGDRGRGQAAQVPRHVPCGGPRRPEQDRPAAVRGLRRRRRRSAFARRVRPAIEMIELSAKTGEGFDAWMAWLDRSARRCGRGAPKRGRLHERATAVP